MVPFKGSINVFSHSASCDGLLHECFSANVRTVVFFLFISFLYILKWAGLTWKNAMSHTFVAPIRI